MMLLMTAPQADDGYDVVEFLIGKGTLPASMRETQAILRKGVQEMDALFPGVTSRLNQCALMLSREQGRARAAEMPPGQPSPETLHALNGSGGLSAYMLPQQTAELKADPPTPVKPALSAVARKYEREYLANPHFAAVGLSLEDYAQHRAWEDSQAAQRAASDPAYKPENARYVDEYRTNPNLAKVGLSLEDYIAGRRVDDGLDVLQASATASDGNAARAAPEMLRPMAGAYEVGSELW